MGMDRGLVLPASLIAVTKYMTEPLKGGRIQFGLWFSEQLQSIMAGKVAEFIVVGKYQMVSSKNQRRRLKPQKGVTSESRPLVTYISPPGSAAPGSIASWGC